MMDDPENHTDFQEWPAEWGAPWVDVDGDGSYNPLPEGTDHPDLLVIRCLLQDHLELKFKQLCLDLTELMRLETCCC